MLYIMVYVRVVERPTNVFHPREELPFFIVVLLFVVVVVKVISTLKKITLQEEGREGEEEEDAGENDTTSLDKPQHRSSDSPRYWYS